jgi:hypothetical protein
VEIADVMKTLLLLAATIICFASAAVAQDARATYARGGERRIVALSGMVERSQVEGCTRMSFVGSIAGVEYDEAGVQPEAFGLKMRGGRRERVHIDPDFISRLPHADRGWLYTIFVKGKRVRVGVYVCGTSGRLSFAAEMADTKQ